ncbi:MAG: dihydropteroate synthase [Oscillospiraceae bacterium]|nr:dihydropteroate synthase [Oscillospiraceae bacterium]
MTLSRRPAIMGIVNVTPDSFHDGGSYLPPAAAVAHALNLMHAGADIIDVGAVSTRPGHPAVTEGRELARLIPVLDALRGKVSVPLSVDTVSPAVAAEALARGVTVLNDQSGGRLLPLALDAGADYIGMYPGGEAAGETFAAVRAHFERLLAAFPDHGRLCLDPGIGFCHDRMSEIDLIERLPELLDGLPPVDILVGVSHKRLTKLYPDGTRALEALALRSGATVIRTHEVAGEAKE